MFDFFKKKYFLKDLLEGFVDIHCHILPGIDDGAQTIEESITLIKKYAMLGIDQFIATPHIMQDYYGNNDVTIANAFEKLHESLSQARLTHILIHPSAEYMMDSQFDTLLEEKNIHPLKDKYILVEMSYYQPPINLEDIIFRIQEQGYYPVLAHPERYSFFHNKKKYYHDLKEMGCFFQMNMLSLTDHYGKNVQKVTSYLMEQELIDFIGTDTHRLEHLEKISNLHTSKKVLDTLKHYVMETNEVFNLI